jgi:hypothetical protein
MAAHAAHVAVQATALAPTPPPPCPLCIPCCRLEVNFLREGFDQMGRAAVPNDGASFQPIPDPFPDKPLTPPGAGVRSVTGAKPRAKRPTTPQDGVEAAAAGEEGAAAAAAAASGAEGEGASPDPSRLPSPVRGLLESDVGTDGEGEGGARTPRARGGTSQPGSPQRVRGPAMRTTSMASTINALGTPNTVVEFGTFVELFLREPPRALRFLAAAQAVAGATSAVAGATSAVAAQRVGKKAAAGGRARA